MMCVASPRPKYDVVGRTPPAQSGFTMVELIMTIVIMGIASVGIFSALSFGLAHQADGLPRAQAVALAQAYFDEIMAKRYDENSAVGGLPPSSVATTACSAPGSFDDGESRAQFDDVDDYHSLDDQPPRYADGTTITAYASFRVQVSVRYVTAGEAISLGVASTSDAKVIDLTISSPTATGTRFFLVRANF